MSQQELERVIHELINHDFQKLVQILYRLDIPEKKLREALRDQSQELAGPIIARLIIEREVQKKAAREQFRQQGPIPDDEKW